MEAIRGRFGWGRQRNPLGLIQQNKAREAARMPFLFEISDIIFSRVEDF